MSTKLIKSKGDKAMDVKYMQQEERFWAEFAMRKKKINTNKSPNNIQN